MDLRAEPTGLGNWTGQKGGREGTELKMAPQMIPLTRKL